MKWRDNSMSYYEYRKNTTRYHMDDLTISRYYHLGPNSIVQTLPQPNVSMICNQPYVSLRQCIVNLLGKGNYPQGIAYESLDVGRNITKFLISLHLFKNIRMYNIYWLYKSCTIRKVYLCTYLYMYKDCTLFNMRIVLPSASLTSIYVCNISIYAHIYKLPIILLYMYCMEIISV